MNDMGMNSYEAVDGGAILRRYNNSYIEEIRSTGINQYLRDMNLRRWYARACDYSFDSIKYLINEDIPVSIGVNGENVGKNWGKHQLVVHGYMVGYAGDKFVYINDTFGRNGVIINGADYLYNTFAMWYIR